MDLRPTGAEDRKHFILHGAASSAHVARLVSLRLLDRRRSHGVAKTPTRPISRATSPFIVSTMTPSAGMPVSGARSLGRSWMSPSAKSTRTIHAVRSVATPPAAIHRRHARFCSVRTIGPFVGRSFGIRSEPRYCCCRETAYSRHASHRRWPSTHGCDRHRVQRSLISEFPIERFALLFCKLVQLRGEVPRLLP